MRKQEKMTACRWSMHIAIATAVSRLKAVPARSRVLLLVTDGANNAGQIDPDTATR